MIIKLTMTTVKIGHKNQPTDKHDSSVMNHLHCIFTTRSKMNHGVLSSAIECLVYIRIAAITVLSFATTFWSCLLS